jgi:hypothetical protein
VLGFFCVFHFVRFSSHWQNETLDRQVALIEGLAKDPQSDLTVSLREIFLTLRDMEKGLKKSASKLLLNNSGGVNKVQKSPMQSNNELAMATFKEMKEMALQGDPFETYTLIKKVGEGYAFGNGGGLGWFGLVWFWVGLGWFGLVWVGLVLVWFVLVWFWFGLVWFGLVWFWLGLVLAWLGLVCFFFLTPCEYYLLFAFISCLVLRELYIKQSTRSQGSIMR